LKAEGKSQGVEVRKNGKRVTCEYGNDLPERNRFGVKTLGLGVGSGVFFDNCT
jgi:hypothetical protein